jgi:DNA/RNA endonuclease YhcR with UshA esterase domain
MDDASVAKIALAASIAGIAGLFVLSQAMQPEQVKIADIDASDTGDIVLIEGKLTSASEREGNYFFTVNDGSEIRVVVFESSARRIPDAASARRGDSAKVAGQVAIYRGELEIIAQALNVLSD